MELSNKILSDITVHMKYAKYIPELNRRETWEELVTRNKNMHIKRYPELKEEIELKYKYVYEKKVLPSMRSMQFAGKPIEISPNRVYNCAFLPIDHVDAFFRNYVPTFRWDRCRIFSSKTSCRNINANQ